MKPLRRICYVIPSLSVGGTERQLIHLLRGVVHDYETLVICTHHDGALSGDARRTGALVRVLNTRGGWDIRQGYRLWRIFSSRPPDIVHSFLFGFDLMANLAARRAGVPVVISSRRQLAMWKKPRHVFVQKLANRHVDCVVANSQAVARYAIEQEQAAPGLFRVIPNGVVADDFLSQDADRRLLRLRYSVPFNRHVIGIVANFSSVKDHALFVDIAAELLRRRADVHFLMVGTGPDLAHIEHLIASRNLTSCFTRVSTVSEMPDLLAMTDVSVLCSKAEGFPNAVIEAMAARKPVVAAAVGGVPELVRDGDTGRLVASRAPGDFADAICWMLEHRDEAEAMGQRAGDYVRRELTVENMVNGYRALYAELLRGRR